MKKVSEPRALKPEGVRTAEAVRFEFTSNESQSVLRAVFEDGDRYEGSMQKGAGQTITYSGEDITFDYPVSSIHPDLLGLLCLTVFYPFIGDRALFPMPVSPRLEQAFQNRNFQRRFRFDNVDTGIEAYSGTRMALSFGRGIDSSAVHTMFPDAYVVHEGGTRRPHQGRTAAPSHAHRIVHDLGPERGRVVTSNQQYVSKPEGWHGWTCVAAATLLMATDNDFGMILTGGTLGTTLLPSGYGYFDRFQARDWEGFTGNFWQSAFNAVGLPMFSPVCGTSDYSTMRLSLDLVKAGNVIYCMEQDGRHCFKCSKCLRREMVRAVVDPDHRPNWKPYDQADIHAFLSTRPLYLGHIFSFARDRATGLPSFVTSRLHDVPAINSDWPLRVHTRTFELCDPIWEKAIRERVLEHLDPMEPEHVAELQSWDQSRPIPRRTQTWARWLVLQDRARARLRGRRRSKG